MKNTVIFILALVLIAGSFTIPYFRQLLINEKIYIKKTENSLRVKKEQANQYISDYRNSDPDELEKITTASKKDGIILFHYRNDLLVYWSSNKIPVSEKYNPASYDSTVLKLFNSYYLLEKQHQDSNIYLAFINVFNRYPHSNEFLQSGFLKSYNLPSGTDFTLDEAQGAKIHDERGKYLFSIIIPDLDIRDQISGTLPTVLFFAGLIFLAFFIVNQLKRTPGRKRIFFVALSIFSIVFVRIIQLRYFPVLDSFTLFDPFIYAGSQFAPSLGDLILNTLIVLFIALLIHCFVHFRIRTSYGLPATTLILLFYMIVFLLFYVYAYFLNRSLIYNSNISFLAAREGLLIYTLLGILVFGLNYFAAGLVLIKLLHDIKSRLSIYYILLTFLISSALLFAIFSLFVKPKFDFISIGFFYLMSLILTWHFFYPEKISGNTLRVIILLLFSVYILFFVTHEGRKKEFEIKLSLILSLNNQHDPIAEYLIDDLAEEIRKDTALIRRISKPALNEDELNSLVRYLERKHFTGYWNEYYMQIALCSPQDNILIDETENRWVHCYSFFDTILVGTESRMPDSNFYYIENQPGRISYLGVFTFKLKTPPYETTLYIEMDSKPYSNQLGYPELLLEQEIYENKLLAAYSYAKYYKGELVSKSGDFNYSLKTDPPGSEFTRDIYDDYNHLIYKPNKNSIIILSSPDIKFFDYLVIFSYIFLFYYFSFLLALAFNKISSSDFQLLTNLRSKIQFAVISILIISMLLIASSSVWLNIRNYRHSQENILHEKMQSVLVELTQRFGFEDTLTMNWRSRGYENINQLLIRFSDVYSSDFNLYDLNGNLLATSRYEVFNLGLQGTRINPIAYHKLFQEERSEFSHRETIGKLSFQSAYAPLKNYQGVLLAYLNLPYFTRQQEFQASMSALIITIINIYIILILITIVASVFISNQITRPLEILQNKFRHLKLGHRYEKINYRRKDEIGSLVEEYNKMVVELEKSIELLAQNERETAWREMAKQIAHEIKNPLTPMRLSVQYLQKIWKEKQEDFNEHLNNVAATLIEQIDNLSTIASQFSNFASMPEIKFQNIDIVEVTGKCVELFNSNDDYSISFDTSSDKLFLKSDREQLSRALINIIKNAIQSIPSDRKGKIVVVLREIADQVEISVADNGCGIPDDIKPKIFVPNFTTKSGGMGLGLAISKNITEQLNGTINFTTKAGEGTIFKLQFPLPG